MCIGLQNIMYQKLEGTLAARRGVEPLFPG